MFKWVGNIRAIWRGFDRQQKSHASWILFAILCLNLAGWGLFVLMVMPHKFHFTGLGLGIGVALTAWTLGTRHAFDADHIAAIDNSTRKLMNDGKKPLATGFCFALGHSAVMMIVGAGLTIAARSVFHAVVDPSSTFETMGGALGTSVSACFLWLIAGLNLVVLSGILGVFKKMRHGDYDEEALEKQLQARGLMYRFFGKWMQSINHTWQMIPVGFVFGIGFDTATEVLLLAGTAAAATQGLPFYAVLALPLLFAGGMTLFDSMDGFFMNTAYSWAFAKPVRKVYYNIMITGLSVAVAFVIGAIEVIGVLSTELHLHGWFGNLMANFDLNTAGFIVVGMFVVVWVGALLIWKFGHVESRWSENIAATAVADSAGDTKLVGD